MTRICSSCLCALPMVTHRVAPAFPPSTHLNIDYNSFISNFKCFVSIFFQSYSLTSTEIVLTTTLPGGTSATDVRRRSLRGPVAAAVVVDSEAVVAEEEETEADSVEVAEVTEVVDSEVVVVEDQTEGKSDFFLA